MSEQWQKSSSRRQAGEEGPHRPDSEVRFAFRFDRRYQAAARAFGITPENTWVTVGERAVHAHFGRWLVQTPLSNVCDVQVTGPYSFLKTAGPPRLGITDRSLTFATNGDQGVCIAFAQPVWGFDRLGLLRHPSLTVTVEDVERLAALLGGRAEFASAVRSLHR